MRFAITAVDRCLSVFEALLDLGWRPLKLFTIPPSAVIDVNRAVISRAVDLGIPVQISRMAESDLSDLRERDCEVLVCASYDWRIGNWRPYLPYGVNFHPSPLPEARGPYPAFQAILEGRRDWGVTCHKLEAKFDAGDILDAEPFAMSRDECHESLNLKTQMAFGRLARRAGERLPDLWRQARPQTGGSYWKALTDQDRLLDFSMPVETILRRVRAFGLTESIAEIGGKTVYVRRATGWTESHDHRPGVGIHADGRRTVVAARDGYIALLEWSPLPLSAIQMIGRPVPPSFG
jgi:methionyl-tRNA formyltransferase